MLNFVNSDKKSTNSDKKSILLRQKEHEDRRIQHQARQKEHRTKKDKIELVTVLPKVKLPSITDEKSTHS